MYFIVTFMWNYFLFSFLLPVFAYELNYSVIREMRSLLKCFMKRKEKQKFASLLIIIVYYRIMNIFFSFFCSNFKQLFCDLSDVFLLLFFANALFSSMV